MIILRISRIVTFDTGKILVLPTQPISGPDASVNIRPISSITQAIANMLRRKRAAEHLVPRYQNKAFSMKTTVSNIPQG